jgi:hypothetical protein
MSIRVVDGKVINPEGIEINAVLNCNMRCRSCSHLAPLFHREMIDPTRTYEMLAKLGRCYHASYTKILGGEPLLHPGILDVIEAARASNVSDTILVCTNGTLLHRAPPAFWQAVDQVEVSVYPSRAPSGEQIARFRDLARANGVDLTVNYYDHFRIAYSEVGTDSAALVRDIFATCKLAHLWWSHTAHDGWLYLCPQSVFLPRQLAGRGWDAAVDAVEITDGPGFLDALFALCTRVTPLRACRHCLGSVGLLHPHAETRRAGWRQETRTEDVLDYDYLASSKDDITLDDGCVRPHCPVASPGTGRPGPA